jgi:uncharacterized membrane protein YfcA
VSPQELLWLVLAGLAMGAINNLAGAAGVLGLLAFEEACGMSHALANGSLRIAAITIGLGGWLGFKSRGIAVPRRAWLLALCTVPGALLGVTLALRLPEWAWRAYLLAVMLAVLWQQFRNPGKADAAPAPRSRFGAFLALALVGVHMGFVQVGVGLVAILALTRYHSRDLVEVNTTKMALVIVSAVVSAAEFTRNAAIAWEPAAVLAAAATVGSFWASRWSVAKGHAAVRTVVLAITLLVIVRTLWQMAA